MYIEEHFKRAEKRQKCSVLALKLIFNKIFPTQHPKKEGALTELPGTRAVTLPASFHQD